MVTTGICWEIGKGHVVEVHCLTGAQDAFLAGQGIACLAISALESI